MKPKIISLDPQKRLEKNAQKTMKRFFLDVVDWFPEGMPLDIMIDAIVSAWNVAIFDKKDTLGGAELVRQQMTADLDKQQLELMNKLISYKNKDYTEHHFFIVDMECVHKAHDIEIVGDFRDQEGYFRFLEEEFDPEEDIEEQSGYIDRHVLIVIPKKPYLDWLSAIDFEDDFFRENEAKTISTFLIDEMFDTAEEWIRDFHDHIFNIQLTKITIDQDDWPKNRSLPVFKKWFDVQFSTFCYDLEMEPVLKN